MKPKSYVWVLRDLHNGDGATGRPHPTYIWVFQSKQEALNHQEWHNRSTRLADLGPLEQWEKSAVYHFYDRGTCHFQGHYCVRRSKDWLD